MTSILGATTLLFLSQVVQDPLSRKVDEVAKLLRAEEQRYQLGATTAEAVAERRREWIRAQRAVALRDNASTPRIGGLFEEETRIVLKQLEKEELRYQLGVSNQLKVAEKQRDLLEVRRAVAGWQSRLPSSTSEERSAARQQVRTLLEEEIAVAQRQLQMEQQKVDLGALDRESLDRRRVDIAHLQAALTALAQQ